MANLHDDDDDDDDDDNDQYVDDDAITGDRHKTCRMESDDAGEGGTNTVNHPTMRSNGDDVLILFLGTPYAGVLMCGLFFHACGAEL